MKEKLKVTITINDDELRQLRESEENGTDVEGPLADRLWEIAQNFKLNKLQDKFADLPEDDRFEPDA